MASVVTENLLITSKELLGGRENRLRGLEELKEEFLFSFLWFSSPELSRRKADRSAYLS